MITLQPDIEASPPVSVRVEHVDVDSYGVVHFSRYVSLMETATLELLGQHALSIPQLLAEGLELRVSEVYLKYRKAALLGDVLTFAARVSKLMAATVTFAVTATRASGGEVEVIVTGNITMAFVCTEDMAPVQVPECVNDRLREGADHGAP